MTVVRTVESGNPRPGGLCLVLGAGGFRGLAHAGVLRALCRAGVPVRSIIGSSIGGLVGAFYAALGDSPERIFERLAGLTTPRLFAIGAALRRWGPISRRATPAARPFLEDFERLRNASLERLHHGVERLGILALNLPSLQEVFGATGLRGPLSLHDLTLGGASIPGVFPAVKVRRAERTYRLVDGGFSHSVPVERAFEPPFSAHRVLAVDLQVIQGLRERGVDRWDRVRREHGDALIRLRPVVETAGTVFFSADQAGDLLRAGEEVVSPQVLAGIAAGGISGSPPAFDERLS